MEVSTALFVLRALLVVAAAGAIAWLVWMSGSERKTSAGFADPERLWGWAAGLVASAVAALLMSVRPEEEQAAAAGVLWISTMAGALCAQVSALVSSAIAARSGTVYGRADAVLSGLLAPLLLAVFLISRHTARSEAWLAAAAAGAAVYAATYCLALAFGRVRESDGQIGAMAVTAATTATITTGILLGKLHFPGIKRSGEAVAYSLALAVVVWLICGILQRTRASQSSPSAWAAWAAYLIVTAVLAWVSSSASLMEAPFVYCLLAGLATGAIVSATGSLVSESELPYTRAVVFGLVVAAAGLSIRLLGGFGAVTAGAGFLMAIPAWALLAPVRDREQTCAVRIPVGLFAAAGTMSVFGLLRVWLEIHDSERLLLGNPYIFLGLCAGVGLPLFASTTVDEAATRRLRGAYASVASLIWMVTVGIGVALVAMVLRESALRMFLAGLGAATVGVTLTAASRAAKAWAVAIALAAAALTAACGDQLGLAFQEMSRSIRGSYVTGFSVVLVALFLALEFLRHRGRVETPDQAD